MGMTVDMGASSWVRALAVFAHETKYQISKLDRQCALFTACHSFKSCENRVQKPDGGIVANAPQHAGPKQEILRKALHYMRPFTLSQTRGCFNVIKIRDNDEDLQSNEGLPENRPVAYRIGRIRSGGAPQ
jgi:hypothetical protein